MHDDWDEIDFARVTTAAASTTRRVVTVQIAALGNEGDDNTSERGDDVEVIQPLGLMAVPSITATTEAPFMRLGDRQVALAIIDKGATPQTVETGEVRLYGPGASNATAVLRIRADGSIEITAKASQNITLNGGTLHVARHSDAVQTTIDAIAAGGITAPPGGGPCTLTAGPITLDGTITGAGADHVLA